MNAQDTPSATRYSELIEALLNGNGGTGKCNCETCSARRDAATAIRDLVAQVESARSQSGEFKGHDHPDRFTERSELAEAFRLVSEVQGLPVYRQEEAAQLADWLMACYEEKDAPGMNDVRLKRAAEILREKVIHKLGKRAFVAPSDTPSSIAARNELADELERLAAEVTPGPWAWDQRGEKINEWALGTAFDAHEKPLSGRFDDEDAIYDVQVCQTEGATVNYTDPALICALRNNLPEIIAALRGGTPSAIAFNKNEIEKVLRDWRLIDRSIDSRMAAMHIESAMNATDSGGDRG